MSLPTSTEVSAGDGEGVAGEPVAGESAASETVASEAGAERTEHAQPAERLHPIALLSGFGKALRNMVGGLFAGGFVAFQGRPVLGMMILGGLVVSTVIGLALHWLRFSYRVGEDALRIDSGIIGRNHRTIMFDRVQDVSIAQGPLQRLVGVARVTLETGGGSALGQEEGVLDGISLARAEALRELVRSRRGRRGLAVSEETGAEDDEAFAAPLFTMDNRRLVTLGLFNFSLALFAGLFGASQTLGNVANFDPFERDFWRPLLEDSGWTNWILDHQIGLAVAGVVVLGVAGVATGMIRTLTREWGFRLERTGNGLRRRRGLLTRTDVSLPLRRIQAGVIATGPVRERLGWYALSVQSLASDQTDGKSGGDHVLAPLARADEVATIVGELGLSMGNESTAWKPVSKAYVTSFCVAMLPVFPLLLLLGPLRLLQWKRLFYAVEDGRLLLRSGWWQRRVLLLPLSKVQSVDLIETSLSRKFGIATIAIATAGGRLVGHRIPALPRDQASLLRRELLSHLT